MSITRKPSLAHLGYAASVAALAAALLSAPGARAQTVSGGNSTTQPCVQGGGGEPGLACGSAAIASDGTAGIAIGNQSTATGLGSAIAIGRFSVASGNSSVAIGEQTTASGNGAVGVGLGSTASGDYTVSLGWSSKAAGNDSQAIGVNANALGADSAAFGAATSASGANSTAFGPRAGAGGISSLAAGYFASAPGNGDLAFGANAQTLNTSAQTNGNIAIGADSGTADGTGTTLATANGGDAIGIGTAVQSTAKYGVALGAYASVTGTGGGVGNVALGQGSTDTGAGSRAVVSVGSAGVFTRAITNVSAGVVSSTSTDAVNGSQLYSVEQMIGSGGGGAYLPLAGGTMTGAINMGGNGVTGLQAGSVSATSTDAVNGGQLYATNQTVTTAQTTASTALTVADGALQTSGGAMTGGLGMGGNAITSLRAGAVSATSTDAVNGSQLYSVEQMIGSGGGAYLPLAGGSMSGSINMSGNGVTGLQAGSVSATSTDAVNGSQLYATNQTVTMAQTTATAAQTTASTALAVADGALQTTGGTMTGGLSLGGNAITNLAAGAVSATSTDAVNGSQLYTVEQLVSSSTGSGNPYFAANFVGAPTPQANGANSISIGGNSVASGGASIAIGLGAVAQNGAATSIGAGNTASGDGAVSIGDPNTATGMGAVAIGANNTAIGNGAVAIGNTSSAGSAGAVALGAGARAAQVNSVALGSGAVTTQASQIMLGGSGSSVAIGDIAASTAAQAGSTNVMTVDANGTVGQDTTIKPAIATLQTSSAAQAAAITSIQATDITQNNRLTALEQETSILSNEISGVQNALTQLRRETRFGIADAMAMAPAPMPSAPGKTTWTVNVSEYHDAVGQGISFAHRLNTAVPFAISGGVSFGPSNVSVRLGIGGEF